MMIPEGEIDLCRTSLSSEMLCRASSKKEWNFEGGFRPLWQVQIQIAGQRVRRRSLVGVLTAPQTFTVELVLDGEGGAVVGSPCALTVTMGVMESRSDRSKTVDRPTGLLVYSARRLVQPFLKLVRQCSNGPGYGVMGVIESEKLPAASSRFQLDLSHREWTRLGEVVEELLFTFLQRIRITHPTLLGAIPKRPECLLGFFDQPESVHDSPMQHSVAPWQKRRANVGDEISAVHKRSRRTHISDVFSGESGGDDAFDTFPKRILGARAVVQARQFVGASGSKIIKGQRVWIYNNCIDTPLKSARRLQATLRAYGGAMDVSLDRVPPQIGRIIGEPAQQGRTAMWEVALDASNDQVRAYGKCRREKQAASWLVAPLPPS